MIMFTQAASTVFAVPDGENFMVVNALASPGAMSTFVITECEYNGEQAKVALQPLQMSGFYWNTGQNLANLPYPITLGPTQETFILTGSSDGVTIQTAFTPPGPFIHGYDTGTQVLTYGHPSP
jgi:hypothetical protein